MSAETTPISPSRFAAALVDLPLSTLHLKAAELRNSIAHLDYSNEQLKPFAEGTDSNTNGVPDQDCVDAIRENELVIARMVERIALLKAEVEGRGQVWTEFQGPEGVAKEEEEKLVNGTGERYSEGEGRGEQSGSPWTDGTFQTGQIVNGELSMDDRNAVGNPSTSRTNGTARVTANGNVNGVSSSPALNGTENGAGGRLNDEELRRAMEERMRNLDQNDDSEGMHL